MKKMKQLLIVLMAGAALLTACQESTQMTSNIKVALHANYLHPEQVDLHVPQAAGGTVVFTVQSQDTPWIIRDVPDWMTVNPTSGSATTTVTVTVSPNAMASPRVGIFTLSSATEEWAYARQITLTQDGASPYLVMDNYAFAFDGKAHTETVPASSNFDWEVWFEIGGIQWITVTNDGENMTVSVAPNDTQQPRQEIVRIWYKGNEMGSFSVTQVPAEFSYVAEPLDFGINGGSYTLTITSEAPWSVGTGGTDAGIWGLEPWVNISPNTGGEGTTEVTISAAPNPYETGRNCFIFINFLSSGRELAMIPLSQEGVRMELDDVSIQNISAVGGTDHLLLTSNVDWYISCVPDFMTISPMSGSGTTDLTIEIADNPTYDERQGELIINRTGTGFQQLYQVRQRSRRPNFATGTWLTCNDVPQTLKLDVDTFGPWGIVYERSFFDVTPTASDGKQTISLLVDENKGGWRQGAANFRPYGVQGHNDNDESEWWIYVNQDGWREKYHEIPDVVELGEGIPGESYPMDIDIATTDAWSAEILNNPGWVRVAGTSSGAGSGKLQISFDGNPSVQSRTAQVRITFGYLDAVILTLRQPGRHVEVNTNTIYFFEQGGAVLFSAFTNGDPYTVGKEGGDWFTVEKEPGLPYKNYRVVASQMSGMDERTGYVVLTLDGIPASTYQLKIPVIQMTAAGMTRGGFTEDRNLNIVTAPGLSITVTSYSEDQNWSGSRQAQIGGEGYDDDENWN